MPLVPPAPSCDDVLWFMAWRAFGFDGFRPLERIPRMLNEKTRQGSHFGLRGHEGGAAIAHNEQRKVRLSMSIDANCSINPWP